MVPVHVRDEDALHGAKPERRAAQQLLEGAVAAVNQERRFVCERVSVHMSF